MLNRYVAPPVNPVEDIVLPPIRSRELPNGARLHILDGGTQPIVRLELVFNAGKWFEPQPGISHLTAKMLTEGTSSFTARQIAETVAMYGASLECHNGFDRTTITLYCLSKFYTVLLPLVKEVALAPSFPENEFALLLQRTVQNISIERKRTSYVATENFSQLVYGKDHPYSTGILEEELNKVTIDQLKAFHASAYKLDNCEIFLAGQVNTFESVTAETFGFETSGTGLIKEIKAPLEKHQTDPFFVEMPESMQASIRVGCTSPMRKDPDYFPFLILNEVLGGYFGSRLMKNIREDKGFTYGIYSAISARERGSLFYIATDVNFLSANATLREIDKEIKLLQTELINQEELETVQNYMVGKFLNSITSPFEQADKHKNIIMHNLPNDYYSQYIHAIRNISTDIIMRTADSYLTDVDFIKVVVGKRA